MSGPVRAVHFQNSFSTIYGLCRSLLSSARRRQPVPSFSCRSRGSGCEVKIPHHADLSYSSPTARMQDLSTMPSEQSPLRSRFSMQQLHQTQFHLLLRSSTLCETTYSCYRHHCLLHAFTTDNVCLSHDLAVCTFSTDPRCLVCAPSGHAGQR